MAERWFVPRYQDTTSQFQQGLIRGQTSQTSFGVNCRLLWIIENQSQFQNDLELKKELKPYLIWNDKAFHRNHHWPRQFPFYDKTSLKVHATPSKYFLKIMFFKNKSMIF